MIGIEGQKMIKVTRSKGESGGARPLVGGEPPIWACRGKPRGVNYFWTFYSNHGPDWFWKSK